MATDKAAAMRDAEKLLRTGKLAQAVEAYEQIIQDDPDDWETRSLVAQLHVRAGALDTAVDRLVTAADILHLSGDTTKAAALYAKALSIRADHEHALMQLGEIASSNGHAADAVARFTAVADLRDARGDRRGAGELRIRVAQMTPQDVDAHLKAARARLEADPRAGVMDAPAPVPTPIRVAPIVPMAPVAAPVPVASVASPVAQSVSTFAIPAPAAMRVAPAAPVAPVAPVAPASPAASAFAHSAPGFAAASADKRFAPAASVAPVREEPAVMRKKKAPLWSRTRLIAAAAGLVGVALGGAFFGRQYFMPAAQAETTGTLTVTTNPPGLDVIIDGQAKGKSPFSGALSPGNHQLVIARGDERRSIPVTVTAGSQVSQFVELAESKPTHGQLQVRSDPPGAAVSVDGQRRGVAPITLDDLAPGPHTVALESAIGSVTQRVTIEAGTTASLVVPMGTPQGAPVSGWIAITAPIDVQVFENQRLLGSSRTDRIMVSVGRHDLQFANEALGFRASRAVQVAPGQVANVKLDMPKGSMALNAQPWADVTVDGEHIGETPIGNLTLPIGPHEVVFRHPELGERKVTSTVTLESPTRLSVDMRKK